MSRFNIFLIVFFCALGISAFLGNVILIISCILIFVAVTSFGSFVIQFNLYINSINSIQTKEKKVVLSFDDGPTRDVTPKVLDVLKQYNCKAIFFCIGDRIEGNEDILNRIVEEGHIIGNHTYHHSPWFDLYSTNKMYAELQKTNDKIYEVTGLRCNLFRPPFGVTNPMLAKAVRRSGFSVIGWNKRSLDTVIKDKKKVLSRISNNLDSGDIILLHDRMPDAPVIVDEFIQFIKNTDIQIERFDKISAIRCYNE